VTGVAVSTAAGTVAHVTITLVAVLWAGNTGFEGVSMPSPRVVGIVAAILVLTGLVVAFVPVLRRWCLESLVPAARRSIRSFVEVIRSPQSLVMVLGGSALVTVMNVAAFGVSLKAFGESAPWATVAVVYLAGSAIASAAPTPGGLGATEAALVGGLVLVGVSEREAIPAVLLFRLATFWLPILPGWISFVILQRRGDV
jgi:glycosyltransferase 2 family protein